jgi:6-phosphogluconolactonase (cycloisomerase 2 family)
VVLWNNGRSITVSANGAFTLVANASTGEAYDAVVQRQPLDPAQHCTVSNGSGTVTSAPVSNIEVRCAATHTRFAYALNSARGANDVNSISQYRVDPASGQLHLNGYVATPAGPRALSIHPSGRFAYLATYRAQFQTSITPYGIDASTGALVQGAPLAASSRLEAVAFEPRGRFLYVIDGSNNFVQSHVVDQATGALSAAQTAVSFSAGVWPSTPAFDISGKFAFLRVDDLDGNHSLRVYSLDSASGVFTERSTLTLTGNWSLPVLDSMAHLYLLSIDSEEVRGFSIRASDGALSEIAGSPFAGVKARELVFEPGNRFAYASVANSGVINVLSVDATSGALAQVGTKNISGATLAVRSVDAAGRYLYAASNDERIFCIAIDRTNGALGAVSRVRSRSGARSIQLVTGAEPAVNAAKFVYVGNGNSGNVSGYSVAASGALSPLASSPFPTGPIPAGIATSLRGEVAVVANSGATDVSSFVIGSGNGAWSAATGGPFSAGLNPVAVTIGPRGKYAYVLNRNSSDVSAFTLSTITGLLSPLTSGGLAVPPYAVVGGTIPTDIAVDPFGESLFVLDAPTWVISSFGIWDAQSVASVQIDSGELAATGHTAGTRAGARTLTFGPTGEFLYAANSGDDSVSVFRVVTGTPGRLTEIAGSPFTTGSGPVDSAVDPTGRFVYLANCVGDSISAFRSDAETGVLAPLSGSPFASAGCPSSLAIDPAGGFLLVANSNLDIISQFNIDSATGALAPAVPASVATGDSPRELVIVAQPR